MFADNIRKLRNKRGLTQAQIADKIDVARTTYAMYEQGKREPDYETLIKLADFYGASTDYMLTGVPSGQLTLFENENGVFENPSNVRFPIRLKKIMESQNMTKARLSEILEIEVEQLEEFLKVPTDVSLSDEVDLIRKMALILDVHLDYLLGIDDQNKDKKIDQLNRKDEKDIAKRLEKFKFEIENSDGLAFDGEPMSDEAKESLAEAMEHLFRQTQRINKKYIPKKHIDRE